MGVFLGEAILGQFSTNLLTSLASYGFIRQLELRYVCVGRGEYSAWLALLSLHRLAVSSSELTGPENQIQTQIL